MVLSPMESLTEAGEVWESWGGEWGGRYKDPVHFGLRGSAAAAAAGSEDPPQGSTIAQALDFILGFNPLIGTIELVAWLVSLGFPRSKVLRFLKNPVQSVW